MPVESRPRQVVAYRSYRDLYQDEYETYFQIGLADGPLYTVQKLRATLIVPVTRSLQQQLLELHKSDQQATLESFLPRVNLKRLDVTEDRCPRLRARVDALSRVSIVLLKPNVIAVHPVMHRIVIDIGSEHVDATVNSGESAVVRWAVDTMKAMQACAD